MEAQFQIFNEKNWFYLEDGLREAVVKNGKDYTVYTGSHGVMELDDINNNKVEIHLNLERADLARLPAPRYDYYHHTDDCFLDFLTKSALWYRVDTKITLYSKSLFFVQN